MKKTRLTAFLDGYRFVKNILFGVAIALLTIMISVTMIARITGGTPSVFGYSLFRVSSGSMEPELSVGDVVLVRDWDPLALYTGDVITYKGDQGEFKDKMITHRIVTPPYRDGDRYYIVTRGDANSGDDPPIDTAQVVGKFVCKVTVMKALYDWFITPWGLLSIIVLIILAFFNEIVVFVRSLLGFYDNEDKQTSVEDIIEKYQKQNQSGQTEPAAPEKSDEGSESDE